VHFQTSSIERKKKHVLYFSKINNFSLKWCEYILTYLENTTIQDTIKVFSPNILHIFHIIITIIIIIIIYLYKSTIWDFNIMHIISLNSNSTTIISGTQLLHYKAKTKKRVCFIQCSKTHVVLVFLSVIAVSQVYVALSRMGGEDAIHGGGRRRGLTFRRNDFFPEESFKSWGNYARAIMETPWRLKDRVLSRSQDHTELVEMKARSNHEMKKTLTWWDLMWFGIGAVIGSGIFVLTGLVARTEVGPAVVISYVVSGVSALFSVFCYTEFAVEIPVAGSISCTLSFASLLQDFRQEHV